MPSFKRNIIIALAMAALLIGTAKAATLPLPKITGTNDSGFGGFITKVTPCICNTKGFLISISGPYGGDYIFSFSNPPKISVGQFFLIGGPILGGAGGSASCGTDKDAGSCINKKSGKVITILGGIL